VTLMTREDGCADDGGRETLEFDHQHVETSKNRSPGKMKVDPAFEVLSLTAQEFLQAQGITSALNFMANNANELAPAWIKWNEGAFKTTKATSDLRCWKRKVHHRWSSSSTKEGAVPRSNQFAEVLFIQKPVAEAAVPTVEVAPALRVLESEAREFLIAQGITTAEAFLSTKTVTMVNALMDWRALAKKEPLSFNATKQVISKWQRCLRELQSNMSGQPLVEQDDTLKTLSLKLRHFLSSQGIATAEAFLSTNETTIVNALIVWRKRWDSSEGSTRAASDCISKWKRVLRERQSSMSGEPLVELDAELKTLTPIARRFLSLQGIATAEAFSRPTKLQLRMH
jgi:hypothetical protein